MTSPRPLPLDAEQRRLAERSIATLKTLAMDAVEQAKSGHPGTPMALSPLAYALWTRVMSYSAAHPRWPDRDRFVLSCGHASMLLYGVLHLSGYPLGLEHIKAFRQWHSPAAGHPELGECEGVETTTGPLGQGIGNAVGMALAERMLAARFNRPGHEVVDHRTWVIASDGDLMEGVSAEAASLAGHLGLSRLCVFYDDNRITIDGRTDLSFSEDVGARFRAYGWNVLHVALDAPWTAYAEAAEQARQADKPTLVVCRTRIAPGAPTKEDTSEAHGAPLGDSEIRAVKRALGWPEDAQFLVPPEVAAHMREAGARGAAQVAAWEARVVAYRAAHPDLCAELDRVLSGRLPEGWEGALPSFPAGGKMATRQASGKVLQAVAARVPELVGGSADLAGSNNTTLPGLGEVQRGQHAGRTLHFGVREHGMGAILNGMALHGGWRPFGATFLIFSDYMKPAIRLAALMRLPVTYVFTHDSVGVGEDGPTHQPIEQLAGLRAIPGLCVVRPCDANEVAEAWRQALVRKGPTALVLTRQALATLDRGQHAPAQGLRQGGYVLREAPGARLTLVATGSEVELALLGEALSRRQGQPARVVSLPAWDLFAQQPAAEREAVLGPGTLRVGIEAAASLGGERWVGAGGVLVTLDRFGASAPAGRLFQEFGFTAENVARVALQALASARP
ncbi:MAG: transketolase [Planctomycetia bacterium]